MFRNYAKEHGVEGKEVDKICNFLLSNDGRGRFSIQSDLYKLCHPTGSARIGANIQLLDSLNEKVVSLIVNNDFYYSAVKNRPYTERSIIKRLLYEAVQAKYNILIQDGSGELEDIKTLNKSLDEVSMYITRCKSYDLAVTSAEELIKNCGEYIFESKESSYALFLKELYTSVLEALDATPLESIRYALKEEYRKDTEYMIKKVSIKTMDAF